MNRFERNIGFKGEAKLKYLDGEVQVLTPGDFVRCAVTGRTIPLDELRYWSVELQEAYVDAAASLKRYRETHPSACCLAQPGFFSIASTRSRFILLPSPNSMAMSSGRERNLSSLNAVPSSSGSRTQSFSVVTSMAFHSRAHSKQPLGLALGEGVMVGKGARAREPRAVLRQRGVEFLRVGDAGKADDRQHAEPTRIAARQHARLQHRLVGRFEALGERRSPAAFADQQQRIGARQSACRAAPAKVRQA